MRGDIPGEPTWGFRIEDQSGKCVTPREGVNGFTTVYELLFCITEKEPEPDERGYPSTEPYTRGLQPMRRLSSLADKHRISPVCGTYLGVYPALDFSRVDGM